MAGWNWAASAFRDGGSGSGLNLANMANAKGAGSPVQTMAGWKGKKGEQKSVSKGKSHVEGGTKGKASLPQLENVVLGQFVGTIKTLTEPNGPGFIDCENLKRQGFASDVFLPPEASGAFQVGSTVSFTAYLNSKAQPQARDLTLLEATPKKLRLDLI